MCLTTFVADLPHADAAYDKPARRIIFRTGLTLPQQVTLARRLLESAGTPQPLMAGSVLGPCGDRFRVPAADRAEGLRATG